MIMRILYDQYRIRYATGRGMDRDDVYVHTHGCTARWVGVAG